MGAIIGYVRVSTQRQGRSGLGLEAQVAAIEGFAKETSSEVVAIYQEVETGRIADRPQLNRALLHAKKSKARLVIAKLDRLARNVAFVSAVMDSGVDFTAVDNPTATRLTVHILAAVAEHEAVMISDRTKVALAAAKARGVKLGSPVAAHTACAARACRTAKARAKAQNIVAIVRDIERSGVCSLSGIARALQARGVQTPRGSTRWQPGQVARLKEMTA